MRQGFALPAVLAITGVVCLALLTAVEAVDSLGRSARERAERIRFEARALDLEARMTFAALTGRTTTDALMVAGPAGRVAPLYLDGSAYSAAGGAMLAVQDEAGLVNLNTLPVDALPRLVRALGAPPDRADRLAIRLADYIDPDSVPRPGGAEAPDYRRAGLPLPPNGYLRDRVELLGVLGMTDAAPPAVWRAARDLFVTDAYDTPININTAPEAVLVVRYGLSEAQAQRAVRLRRDRPFTTVGDLGRAAGAPLVGDAERERFQPAGRYRLHVTRGRMTYQSRIVLTPSDARRPFRIEQRSVALSIMPEGRQSEADAAPPPVPWD